MIRRRGSVSTRCACSAALCRARARPCASPNRAATLFAEAEPLLVDGYGGMEGYTVMKDNAKALLDHKREALQRLVDLYDASGSPRRLRTTGTSSKG